MKYLFVGDPHVTPEELGDAKALEDYIVKIAQQEKATVILAGDLYHTHALIRAQVQLFWHNFFNRLKELKIRCIVLKGNHDMTGATTNLNGSEYVEDAATPLLAHVQDCWAVLYEPEVEDGILFCPYTSKEKLVEWSNQHPECETLICHQTFNGATYEDGFFAEDGVDPNLIAQKMVISGHIHKSQEFGKVWYPGSPRWRTLSDANMTKSLWILDFNKQGVLLDKKQYKTDKVCKCIKYYLDTPEDPASTEHNAKDEYRVDIKGPQAWIEQRKPLFEGWAKVRTLRTDTNTDVKVKESEGVWNALRKFTNDYKPLHNTDKDVLLDLVTKRIGEF